MNTPRRRPACWLPVAGILVAAACATQPAPLALQPTTLPPNVRLTRVPTSAPAAAALTPERGDIPIEESARYKRIEDLLSARAPRLDVQSLGAGRFVLRVRGRASFSDDREPLVVINGVRYPQNGADVLAAIPPRDVKRIDVLRDAADAGSYGPQGASGVVLVATRHGDY